MNKRTIGMHIEKNAFTDNGKGLITFPNKLVITDNTEQRNGTRYDIDTMDLSEYKGQLTADHIDMLQSVIGKVKGVAKVGTQVVVDAIQFAVKENALGSLAYDLFKGGFITDFSIETYGPMPDEEDVYHDAKLIGLSAVVVGNNRNAAINKIVFNSIKQSKEEGLDVTDVEKNFLTEIRVTQNHSDAQGTTTPPEPPQVTDIPDKQDDPTPGNGGTPEPVNNKVNKEEDMNFVTIKNSREFAIKVSYKNAAGEDTETEVAPGTGVDVSEDQQEKVEQQFKDAKDPKPNDDREALLTDVKNMLSDAFKPLQEKIESIEKNAFDKGAKEPEFKKDENAKQTNGMKSAKNEFSAMDWQERHGKQINAAWDLLKRHDSSSADVLNKINEVNLAELKKEGIVKNSLTISDFGNFVISRELLSEIQGCRNDYTPLVNATRWQETMSTQFAWLNRSGDINMQSVEFCDDGADGNLKPISEYSATIRTADLEELAAVTPVCNAATRFLAADLLGDVAAGYRNDYDRKRAQLVIARLEQAVESNGNSVIFDTNPSVEALVALLNAYKEIANCTPNGTFVMNTSSHATILEYALRAGISGPLSQIFTNGTVPSMFGRPYIVVSDDLMPTLDSASTVSISVDGSTVTVNHGLFYADLTKFTGRTSGGLQYDLSTEAAYEDGANVKSAYQRNELVLRGSFFRGGAMTDNNQVAGILSPGVS